MKLNAASRLRGRCRDTLALLIMVGPTLVLAQGQHPFIWASNVQNVQYDNGFLPSVAASGQNMVEVHQALGLGQVGPLWYRTGQVQSIGTVKWADSFQYDNGAAPSVALSGTTIIEVHQANGAGAVGPLWYKTGRIQADGTVKWAPSSFQYDNGAAPSVALSGTTVIEVHQAEDKNISGPLWYHTGQIQPNGTVKWAPRFRYDTGSQPSVALDGSTILEVHQTLPGNAPGPLWYHIAEVQPNGSVRWAANSFPYDHDATSPSVTLSGPTILEVHQANSVGQVGPLWYRTGQVQSIDTVKWADSFHYDNGAAPSVALSGTAIIEVHQANGAGVAGPLWYKAGQIQADGSVNGAVKWAPRRR